MRNLVVTSCLFFSLTATAQILHFPYHENFDTVSTPSLPSGWQTTTNRLTSGDFATTSSTPYSDSNAVISTNAAINQSLISPLIDFSNRAADSVSFYERRSSSHNAGMLLEASTDGGSSFDIGIGDTIRNSGSTNYLRRVYKLPLPLSNQHSVRLRWHILGNGTGTAGTIRLDDIAISAREQFDVGVVAINAFPMFPRAGDSIIIESTFRNEGTQPAQAVTARFYDDVNGNALPDSAERFGIVATSSMIPPGDTVTVRATISHVSAGTTTIIVTANLDGDQNTMNDTLRQSILIGTPRYSVIINEIMYDPLPGGSEYVELFNRSSTTVNFADWKLSGRWDGTHWTDEFVITKESLLVEPGGFLVIASDSALLKSYPYLSNPGFHFVSVNKSGLNLNNNGDDVVLRDRSEGSMDSVFYFPSWHNPTLEDASGRSLERISPDLGSNDRRNWGTCTDPYGGSPGKKNTLYTVGRGSGSQLSFFPNPFSPDGDGVEDITIISYRLLSTTARIRIRIFDVRGRLVRTLVNGEPGGSHGEVVWDGFDDQRMKVRMGIYIVMLDAVDASGESVETIKKVVVVAAKL